MMFKIRNEHHQALLYFCDKYIVHLPIYQNRYENNHCVIALSVLIQLGPLMSFLPKQVNLFSLTFSYKKHSISQTCSGLFYLILAQPEP